MMRRKRRITALFLSVMMAVLTACGNGGDVQETIAPVEEEKIEEETVVEDKAEAEAEEVDTEETEEKVLIPYFIENELEFNNELSVETQAVRTNVNDETDMEVADAVWTLKSITIENGEEEGTQVVTVESECTSYYWTDRKNRQMYSIMLPAARYCDLNTGKTFPSATEIGDMELGYETTVEWDRIYEIDCTGKTEWDDSKGDWTSDGEGGFIHPTTVYYTDTFVVTEGYDSMGIILSPFTVEGMENLTVGVSEGGYLIEDILEENEGSFLFSVKDVYEMLNEDSVDEDKGNTSTNTETQKESTTTNNSSTTPKQDTSTNSSSSKEDTTPKQEQPTHTHSYTSSVTKNPTCSEEGVRMYSCSCGASYTEAIAKVDHNWQPITESVYHPSTGHYETVTRKEIFCGCGASGFQSMEEYKEHVWANNCFGTCGVNEQTENVWVVDQPEYYSDEVTGYQCSVCGARQ